MAAENKLAKIRDLIHGIKSPFVCNGSFKNPAGAIQIQTNDLPNPVTITPADNVYSQDKSPWYVTLSSKCAPAAFGHGNRTVHDKKVRDALQMKGEDFSVPNFDLQESGILEEIQNKLVPNDPDPLTAELYSLNMYKSMGHFEQHKDTPRSDKMMGTLLIFLPSKFSRGALSVSHKGQDSSFSFGERINEEDKIYWVAFFGDVDHKVEHMWSGVRVTLAYTLNRGAIEEREPSPEPSFEDKTKQLIKLLGECLEDEEFMKEGGKIGFPCYHLYTNGQIFKDASADTSLTMKKITKLKGKDFHVGLAANHIGLDVYLQPYLAETCCDETWKTDTYVQKKDLKRRMCPDSIPGESLEHTEDNVEWVEDTPGCSSRPGKPASKQLKDCEYSATGYFGNEASSVTFYSYAGLIIDIPPVDDEERDELIESAQKAFAPKKGIKRRLSVTETTRKKSRKEVTQKAVNTTRTVHIKGARGSTRKVGDGTGDITLRPGWGLKELKKLIRQQFGKVKYQRLGSLKKVSEDGTIDPKKLTSAHLVDGMTLHCEYVHAAGNPGNLFGGRRRRMFGGMFGF